MSIETMKLALEALDNLMYWDNGKPDYDEAREAITALRQAIHAATQREKEQISLNISEKIIEQAQKQDHFPDATKMVTQKQEPVAWMRDDEMKAMVSDEKRAWILCGRSELIEDYNKPLYTSPPYVPTERQRPVAEPHKPLTDEQITSVWETRPYFNDFARAIEAAHGIMSVPDGKGEPT